jgi:hypothetical protein
MLTAVLADWMKRWRTGSKHAARHRYLRAPRRPLALRSPRLEGLEDRVCPSAFDPADLIVVTQNTLREYTPTAVLAQSFDIPYPGTGAPEQARGVTVGQDGKAFVYNGTFNPYLSSLDPVAEAWSHTTYPGWRTANNASYGGVGRYQQYVFASSTSTAGAPEAGIIRFNLADGTAQRFADTTDYISLTVGLDGNVYALAGPSQIDVYDPNTLSLLRTVRASASPDPRGVAVDANGDIFTSDWNGYVYHFDASGGLVGSLDTNPLNIGLPGAINNLINLDVASDGRLIVGTRFGDLIQTTEAFDQPNAFHISNDAVFVSLVHQDVTSTLGEIHGTVFVDQNGSGVHHPGDPGLAGVTVYLDLHNKGVLDATTAEPDNFDDGTVLNHAIPGLSLSVADANNTPSTFFTVQARTDPIHSTGTKVFSESGVNFWTSDFRFRADFDQPAYTVSLDFISSSDFGQSGILLAYDASGDLLDTYTTATLAANQVETMTIQRAQGDIAYVVAYTNTGSFGHLDNLNVVNDPTTVSDANGNYAFTNLQPGSYIVREVVPDGYQQTLPGAHPGTYYGAAYAGTTGQTQLVTIDSATGTVTRIGGPMSVRIHGLVMTDDGRLYGINGFDNSLYSVDPQTGQVSLIGATGRVLVWGLAYDPGTDTIYGLAETDHATNTYALVTFDRTTGAVTEIGSGIRDLTSVSGLAFDAANQRVLAFANNSTPTFYAFDATTGTATRLATASPIVHGYDMAFDGRYAVIQALDVNDNTVLEFYDPDTGALAGSQMLSGPAKVEALTFVPAAPPYSYQVTVGAGQVLTGLDFGNDPLS